MDNALRAILRVPKEVILREEAKEKRRAAAIPAVKMDQRILARCTCPNCGNDVLIEDDVITSRPS